MIEIDPQTPKPPTSRVKRPRCGAEPGVRCMNVRGFREKAPHGERFASDFPNWANTMPIAPEAVEAALRTHWPSFDRMRPDVARKWRAKMEAALRAAL